MLLGGRCGGVSGCTDPSTVQSRSSLARRAIGEVDDPRAAPARLSHEVAHVMAALPQLAAVTGVVAHHDLRRGQPYRVRFRHGFSLLRGTDVPEGGGVGFAGLRRAHARGA